MSPSTLQLAANLSLYFAPACRSRMSMSSAETPRYLGATSARCGCHLPAGGLLPTSPGYQDSIAQLLSLQASLPAA